MNGRAGFLFVFFLVVSFAHRADTDIAPDPLTGGWPVTPYNEETTDVRMVSEDVLVRIFADSIVTVASFSMRNTGKTTAMMVGFPFPYEKDLLRFRAFVDGHPVAVRGADKENSNGREKATTHWKVWDTTFSGGESCEVRVEYKTKPTESLDWFHWDQGVLPPDALETCRQASTNSYVEYWLETGKPWKGVLDHCRVSFEFVGISDAHVSKYSPQDGVVTKNRLTWDYTNYEPSGRINVEYFPYYPVQEIPKVMLGVVERFPDNPRLTSDVGRFFSAYLQKPDLESDLYHSFLTKWDKPIPQLMEYASGGRCRVNMKADGDFFTVWSMAHTLFLHYKEGNKIESGRDVAPKVSMMAVAILDSLRTCSGTEESVLWLYRDATNLRDLCKELLNGNK